MPAPEFIAIGHVTLDRFGDEVRPGGSALYAAITADRLGLRAGILTSHADDFPLDLVPPRIEVVSVPAPATTVFEHERVGDDRAQRVTSVAGALLYVNGDRYEVRPRRAIEADSTGAGDVFAATFLARYRRNADPWEAAEAATCAASLSVQGLGWSAIPDAAELEAALRAYRRAA